MHRVLVAVDESEASTRVAEFVNRFFGDLEVEVLAINVGRAPTSMMAYAWIDPVPYVDPRMLDPRLDAEATLEAEHKAEAVVAASTLKDDEVIIELGDPAEAIMRAAEEHQVDIIIVGASDRGLLSRLITPSVSRKVADEADRPVLIVH